MSRRFVAYSRRMDERVEFFVPGVPKPAGSKVSGVAHRRDPETGQQVPVYTEDGRLKTFTKDDTGDAGKAWRTDVRAEAKAAMIDRAVMEGAVSVTVTFVMPRNKGHFGSGRNAGVLKPTAPRWHTVRPDIDKLSRAVLDALTGIVWRDDGQVVQKHATKRYADAHEPPGAQVWIEPPVEARLARQLQMTPESHDSHDAA
jgi:Holliday junction resolvase RusA-like endonuclease